MHGHYILWEQINLIVPLIPIMCPHSKAVVSALMWLLICELNVCASPPSVKLDVIVSGFHVVGHRCPMETPWWRATAMTFQMDRP